MKKVAIMLDGSFVLKSLRGKLKRSPTTDELYDFAYSCVSSDEELFRIYYYDCPPYAYIETHPLTQKKIDFSEKAIFGEQKSFQDKLSRMDHIAFRSGVLSFNGWKIGDKAWDELIKKPRSIKPRDLVPDLKQKRVDIKIGLDIAWLSSKNIVSGIILVTGDADFIPAMKFARREGVQIILVTLGNKIKIEMREHVDIFREFDWSPKEVDD